MLGLLEGSRDDFGQLGGMSVEEAAALFIPALAATVMIMTALTVGVVLSLATIYAIGITQSLPPGAPLLAAIMSAQTPVTIMVLLQTGSLSTITEFMAAINFMMILVTL